MHEPSLRLWARWTERGDDAAFEALVRPVLPLLRDAARRTGLDASASDDAVQDALAELARERSTRPLEVGLVAWLVRAVRLRALTLGRTARRRAARERRAPPRTAPAPSAAVEAREPDAREEAERVLHALAPAEREILRLRFVYDLAYREIAFVLGVPEATCRVRVHRAAQHLRARFGRLALALLPAARGADVRPLAGLRAAPAATGTGALSLASGGMLMTTGAKLAATGLLAALLLGTLAATRGGVGPGTERPAPESTLLATRTDGPAPVLRGRPQPEAPADLAAPPEPAPAPAPAPVPEPARPARLSIQELVAQVRTQVEPAAWGPAYGGALTPHGSVLAARAAPHVLEAVGVYLERLRSAASAGSPAAGAEAPALAPEGPVLRETEIALQAILRLNLEQDERLRALLGAAGRSEAQAARVLLEQIREAQPDLALLPTAERALVSPEAAAELARSVEALAQASGLREWLLRWPSAASWTAASSLGDAWRADRGASPARRLDGLRVQRASLGGPLPGVLRALEVEGLVDILVDRRVAAELAPARVAPFATAGRTVRQVLDDVVRALPAWVRIDVRPDAVHLTRSDLLPELRWRYFDVTDLVAEGAAGPGGPAAAPAPGPPEGVVPLPPTYVAPPPTTR